MIDRFTGAFPVRLMCRCLKVSPSGYYAWRKRAPAARTLANRRLLTKIKALHAGSDGILGSGRITRELRAERVLCSQNRVARLMRGAGLRGIPQRRRWGNKPTGERPNGVKNHLDRQFDADRPNAKWATDITYIPSDEGWLYLAVVLDLYQSEVVGWATSSRQDTHLALQAVLMATWQRQSSEPTILHSDRGTQYTSFEYQRFLKDHNLVCSMSAVGSCADNAAVEGFFGMLKRERVNRRKYSTRAQARSDIFDYIERFYNPARRRTKSAPTPDEKSLTQVSTESG